LTRKNDTVRTPKPTRESELPGRVRDFKV
jgi:hypothetical protein